MYQAIVFLPLLGAILAGIIALAGARARFPGKGPVAGADHGPTLARTTARLMSTAAQLFIPLTMKKKRTNPPLPVRVPPS